MRLTWLVLLVCLAIAPANILPAIAQGTAAGSPGLESQAGPLAEVPEKLYDFGDLSPGQDYVHAFVVRNIGTAPLEITKVIKL